MRLRLRDMGLGEQLGSKELCRPAARCVVMMKLGRRIMKLFSLGVVLCCGWETVGNGDRGQTDKLPTEFKLHDV